MVYSIIVWYIRLVLFIIPAIRDLAPEPSNGLQAERAPPGCGLAGRSGEPDDAAANVRFASESIGPMEYT